MTSSREVPSETDEQGSSERRQVEQGVARGCETGDKGGARVLSGSLRTHGYRIARYQFDQPQQREWLQESRCAGLQICLNLAGHGEVRAGLATLAVGPGSVSFYRTETGTSKISRRSGENHQFITIDLSMRFLERYLTTTEPGLARGLEEVLDCKTCSQSGGPPGLPLTCELRQLATHLCSPPVTADGWRLWYQAKVFEVLAMVLYRPADQARCSSSRQKLLNQERVLKVKSLLKQNYAETLSLEEIARQVGCSHCYLSRIFACETGQTISAYLRTVRLEKAAALLQMGRLNVTEVAMDVGYSSLSHFSQAFRQHFGCQPVLFPMAAR